MSPKCCVMYCTTYDKKMSFFQFPKNEILKEKWIKAIPGYNLTVKPRTLICEKHFCQEQIIRTWESGSGASKVVVCIIIFY